MFAVRESATFVKGDSKWGEGERKKELYSQNKYMTHTRGIEERKKRRKKDSPPVLFMPLLLLLSFHVLKSATDRGGRSSNERKFSPSPSFFPGIAGAAREKKVPGEAARDARLDPPPLPTGAASGSSSSNDDSSCNSSRAREGGKGGGRHKSQPWWRRRRRMKRRRRREKEKS